MDSIFRFQERTADLEKSRSRLAAAIEATGGGIYEHAVPPGPDTYHSERWAEILGYTLDELPAYDKLSDWMKERIHPDDIPLTDKEYEDFIEGGTAGYHVEIRMLHKSGEWRWVEMLSRVFSRDAEGRATNIVGVMLDVTENKRLRDELLQSQKMEAIGQLTGAIAHDFNNLMTVVNGYGRRIMRKSGPEGDIAEYAGQIVHAGERAATLTKHLLAFGRKQVMQPRRLNVNDVLRDFGKVLRTTMGEDVDILQKLSREVGEIEVDPVQMEQVLLNVALNSRHAMPKGGKLTIETCDAVLEDPSPDDVETVPPGRYVMLGISDTGLGMDEETRRRAFEPFFTTKPEGEGTGLGLSTVYGIVRQSGGVVRIYSEPGEGTTVKIYYPCSKGGAETETGKEPAGESRTGSEKILLVEDNESVRGLIVLDLQDAGYTVVEAGDSTQAQLKFRKHGGRFDLLLTDVILPGESGKDIYDKLAGEQPGLKVLFMSGHTENHIVHRGVLNEDTNFIMKPFTGTQLTARIRQVLDG